MTPRASDRASPPRLSEEIARLIAIFAERSVTVREVIAVLHGRAYTLLLILLALPFCTPIPLPGLSTPFGIVIALVGFRLSVGQAPWLPHRLLEMTLPPRFFATVLSAGQRVVRALEWALRPRWSSLFDYRAFSVLQGAIVCVCGVLLMLPLPIPFTNSLPAIVVILSAAALLERDGYCAAAALAVFVLTLGFFAALAWGAVESVGWLRDWLGHRSPR